MSQPGGQRRGTAGGWRPAGDLLISPALGLAALALELITAARDIAWGDAVEFTASALDLGIPHPTGYPLYGLLARLAAAVPLGPLAWRVNALSGIAAAAAVAVTFHLGRALGLSRAAAASAALALLAAREVWLQATAAEVYTLHLLIAALLLWSTLRWRHDRQPRWLMLAAYLVGIGLAHHLTVVLLLPAVLWLAWTGGRRPPLTAALWVLLPLGLYLVLLIRSHADPLVDQGNPDTLGRLLTHLSGRQFRYRLFSSTPGYMLGELRRIAVLLAHQWWPPVMALAAAGAVHLGRRRPAALGGLLAVAVAVGLYAAAYNIPDKDGYLLPAVLVLALLLGAGAELAAAASRWRPARRAAATLCVLWPLALLPLQRAAADRHADRSLRDLTLEAYGRTTPGSLICTDDTNTYFAFLYLHAHEGELAGRQAALTYLLPLPWYAEALHERLPGVVSPELVAATRARRRATAALEGAALGRQRAADQQALAAALARAAAASRRVYLYRHDFTDETRSWQGMPLADRGLIFELVEQPTVLSDTTAIDFRRAAHYATDTVVLDGEQAVARRYATAANREGIRRVELHAFAAAARAFTRAVRHDPAYAQPWLNLGLLEADYLGDPGAARRAWQRYLALADESSETAAVRRRLAALPPAP